MYKHRAWRWPYRVESRPGDCNSVSQPFTVRYGLLHTVAVGDNSRMRHVGTSLPAWPRRNAERCFYLNATSLCSATDERSAPGLCTAMVREGLLAVSTDLLRACTKYRLRPRPVDRRQDCIHGHAGPLSSTTSNPAMKRRQIAGTADGDGDRTILTERTEL